MLQSTLNRAIAEHELWVDTMGEKGRRLQLWGADLSGLSVSGACLLGAEFRNCQARNVTFLYTILTDSVWDGSDLSYSTLYRVTARDTLARFTICSGLKLDSESIWTGADFRGAVLEPWNRTVLFERGATFGALSKLFRKVF